MDEPLNTHRAHLIERENGSNVGTIDFQVGADEDPTKVLKKLLKDGHPVLDDYAFGRDEHIATIERMVMKQEDYATANAAIVAERGISADDVEAVQITGIPPPLTYDELINQFVEMQRRIAELEDSPPTKGPA